MKFQALLGRSPICLCDNCIYGYDHKSKRKQPSELCTCADRHCETCFATGHRPDGTIVLEDSAGDCPVGKFKQRVWETKLASKEITMEVLRQAKENEQIRRKETNYYVRRGQKKRDAKLDKIVQNFNPEEDDE